MVAKKTMTTTTSTTTVPFPSTSSSKTMTGILRLDIGKSRTPTNLQCEPVSPQPSVTFADCLVKENDIIEEDKMENKHLDLFKSGGVESLIQREMADDEDYSASVNAIFQRKASTRKSRKRGSRRSSSPFNPDVLSNVLDSTRRRSSIFTTSSGDTAITVDENVPSEVTQEEIFENIKLHKEVLSNVKMQPWSIRKKLKLVIQAKNYIKKHEGALQERFAQSHSTKDMLARCQIFLIKKWQRYKREIANFTNWFLPWEKKIKEIESHFGSVVASYFIFLRWLFWVNIVLAIVLISFVAVPEMLTADPKAAGDRKFILTEEKYNSTNFLTLWDFEGIFKYSPLFYGWYTNREFSKSGYRLPFAYFITGLVVYAYSFVATLRKMAENSRMSKLSEKDDECIFSWKLFTAWDYMIGNAETAHNRVASIVMGFKEALLEEVEKQRQSRNWKVICFRIFVNTLVIGLLSFSAFAVVMVVKRSTEPESTSTVWRRNEITIVLSLISLFFPMFFEVLGFCEKYHPRKQLRLQLARIMVLNLLNLYSLIFALFDKIGDMTNELQNFRNLTPYLNNSDQQIINLTLLTNNSCHEICLSGVDLETEQLTSINLISSLAFNISLTLYPILMNFSTAIKLHTEIYANNNSINFTNNENNLINNDDVIKEDFQILQNAFVDYLTYILFSFDNRTNNDNNTYQNYTDFNIFKSTITPLFINNTIENYDENFDHVLSSAYDDFVTTINLLEKNITEKNCLLLCKNNTFTSTISIMEISLNYSTKSRLRSLCWETMFGQELIKLTVMDLILTVLSTLAIDFFRGLFVRIMNSCWCWDLEKKFPQYGEFKVAENILHLVNNQGMVWMGMFFSPGLVVLNVIKLYIMMYLRAWAVLTCNVPPEITFRASRSNNFYYALLLMMLFLCVLPVGYIIVWIKPSWHCGPFSNYQRIFHIFTKTIKDNVPESVQKILEYIASPGIVIPLLVLLILIIYYLISLTNALREANNDLKIQLRKERTEERRKMFQIADRCYRNNRVSSQDEINNYSINKWPKIFATLTSFKNSDDMIIIDKHQQINDKKTLSQKPSTSDDDPNTDNDYHESLPDDSIISQHIIKVSDFDLPSTSTQNDEKFKYKLKKYSKEMDENLIFCFGKVFKEKTVSEKISKRNDNFQKVSETSNIYNKSESSDGNTHDSTKTILKNPLV